MLSVSTAGAMRQMHKWAQQAAYSTDTSLEACRADENNPSALHALMVKEQNASAHIQNTCCILWIKNDRLV
jgi:hypothetical protein